MFFSWITRHLRRHKAKTTRRACVRPCRLQVEQLEDRDVPAAILDNTFGVGGMFATTFGQRSAYVENVARQEDGKLVVVGGVLNSDGNWDFAITRHRANGRRDWTFGSNGMVGIDFAGGDDGAERVKVLPSGKILAAGWAHGPTGKDFAVVRLMPDGREDRTFGNGGRVSTDFGSARDYGLGLAVQTDGKIVVVGKTGDTAVNQNFALARYTRSGSLDVSFGRAGKVVTDVSGNWDNATDVVVQPNGRIVVGGSVSTVGGGWLPVTVGYRPNGARDRSYGRDGVSRVHLGAANGEFYELVQQADGMIVAAGYRDSSAAGADFLVARFNSNGRLDRTFSDEGWTTVDFGSRVDFAFGVAVQPDGQLLAAGYAQTATRDFDFAVAQLQPSGKLRQRFTSDFARGFDGAFAVLPLGKNRVLVAGSTQAPSGAGVQLALARYNFVSWTTKPRTHNMPPLARVSAQLPGMKTDYVALSASASSDPNQDSDRLTYLWDLDGDGVFGETGAAANRGDEVGMYVTFQTAELEAGTHTVSLQVTDYLGLQGVTPTTVTIE